MQFISKFLKDESGATAAEYALIIALIAGVIVGGLNILGPAINGKLSTMGTTISGTAA